MTRLLHTTAFAGIALGAIVAAELAWLVVVPVPAYPHDVPGMGITYSPECCNSAAMSPTGDCAPIDDRYVSEEPDGYHINLPVGSHPRLITKGYSGIVPYTSARQPINNSYHICLATDGIARFCFFAKPGAV